MNNLLGSNPCYWIYLVEFSNIVFAFSMFWIWHKHIYLSVLVTPGNKPGFLYLSTCAHMVAPFQCCSSSSVLSLLLTWQKYLQALWGVLMLTDNKYSVVIPIGVCGLFQVIILTGSCIRPSYLDECPKVSTGDTSGGWYEWRRNAPSILPAIKPLNSSPDHRALRLYLAASHPTRLPSVVFKHP